MKAILVVDFGTSNVRASLIRTDDGTTVALATEKNMMKSMFPGFAELDPIDLWNKSVSSVKRVVDEGTSLRVDIVAVSFSFFGDSLIPVNQYGEPVYSCILSLDERGQEQAKEINSKLSTRTIIEAIGTKYESFHTGSRILYLRQRMPEIYSQTTSFYSIQQFINHRLGLAPLNDDTLACRKNLYDLRARCWSTLLLQAIDINESQLGDVVPTSSIIGRIDRYGSVKLANRVPVIIGGHDSDLGILGLGLYSEEQESIANITGTFDHIGYLANGSINLRAHNQNANMLSYLGPLPDTSVCLGAFPTSGALLEWFMREIIGDTSQSAYADLWYSTIFDGKGTEVVLPHLLTSNCTFGGIGLRTRRIDLFKAVIESLTFETRKIVDECKQTKKGTVKSVRIGGGAAQSAEWMQLRADITGNNYESTKNFEVSSLGAAILAAVGIGVYPDVMKASKAMVQVTRCFQPNQEISARFEDKYQTYLALQPK